MCIRDRLLPEDLARLGDKGRDKHNAEEGVGGKEGEEHDAGDPGEIGRAHV